MSKLDEKELRNFVTIYAAVDEVSRSIRETQNHEKCLCPISLKKIFEMSLATKQACCFKKVSIHFAVIVYEVSRKQSSGFTTILKNFSKI